MAPRLLMSVLFLLSSACGGEDEYCGFPPQWKIAVTDDSAPLTPEPRERVARLDVLRTERCQRSLSREQFFVEFVGPDDSLGKTTRAVFPENLLVMELEDDDGDGRLGAGEALLLFEGPVAVVPPGIDWVVWLMFGEEGPSANMARSTVHLE